MSSSTETDPIILQPHLLTKFSLIHLLEQKCMNIKHLNTMSKEQLVELFQRIALPLPQRKYKQNYRGKLLTRLRNEKEGPKKKSKEIITGISIGFGESSSAQSKVGLGIGDRLKPPPDTVNFERRKIRLNSSGNSKSNDLDHIQIKKRKSEVKNGLSDDDQQEANGEHKTNTSSPQVEVKPNGSTKIVLKRSHSGLTKQSSPQDQEPEKKKEKKLITWP